MIARLVHMPRTFSFVGRTGLNLALASCLVGIFQHRTVCLGALIRLKMSARMRRASASHCLRFKALRYAVDNRAVLAGIGDAITVALQCSLEPVT